VGVGERDLTTKTKKGKKAEYLQKWLKHCTALSTGSGGDDSTIRVQGQTPTLLAGAASSSSGWDSSSPSVFFRFFFLSFLSFFFSLRVFSSSPDTSC